jgi:hypothetical protein
MATAHTSDPRPGDAPKPDEPPIGAVMKDGTIYAGVSPDTGKPMYATPRDAPLMMSFNQAADYAAGLNAHGHRDWRVPTKDELNLLFNHRAAIAGFDLTVSSPASWYWSSSEDHQYGWHASEQCFSNGCQYSENLNARASVRCVR